MLVRKKLYFRFYVQKYVLQNFIGILNEKHIYKIKRIKKKYTKISEKI